MWYVVWVNYHPDDFLSLVEEVEAQGGAHLASETCRSSHFQLSQPLDSKNLEGQYVRKRISTSGCNRSVQFLVQNLPEAYFAGKDLNDTQICMGFDPGPLKSQYRIATSEDFDFEYWEKKEGADPDEMVRLTKVCAIDDSMGLWPRFEDTMHTGESFEVVS